MYAPAFQLPLFVELMYVNYITLEAVGSNLRPLLCFYYRPLT